MTSCKVRYYHKGAISDGLGTRLAHVPSRDRISYAVNRGYAIILSSIDAWSTGIVWCSNQRMLYIIPCLNGGAIGVTRRAWMGKKIHAKRAKSMYLLLMTNY